MAKRKTPKTVDLKPQAERITDQQLEKLQQTVKSVQMAQSDIGALEARKHEALHAVLQMQSVLMQLQEEFKKEYGTDDMNIADGKIKYNDDKQADKKDNDR